ncbi:DUF2267 domain-containing protein [Kibdelosporangium aridum]|uniref:DUF2267 domain-containing protein n=1 Tax=Kibdelosporangium aridum TaxID=2030 RepID=A0A428ZB65_KIBAR|nr:DUF2267 domain-containing protein [Kibdelosporangium aridum]RSM85304.1 DUF2267 domain-containing protein [Kibdelosporangium aridum]
MTHQRLFAHAESTALEWLRVVADRLDTDDLHEAYQLLRPWLHILRDRLPVDSAVHLAAQLPELLRGMYYDGWQPSKVPIRLDVEDYLTRYQQEARIPARDVNRALAAITSAMSGLFSPGQLDTVLGQLPAKLRAILNPALSGRTL